MTIRTLDQDLATGYLRTDDPKTIAAINELKILLNDNRKKVLYGRYTLFAIAVIALITAAVLHSTSDASGQALPGLLLTAAIYLVCGVVSFRFPTAALLAGLGIYVLDHLSYLYFDPALLLQGWMLKVGIVTALGLAVHGALERRKLVGQLEHLPVSSREIHEARKLVELRRTRQRARGTS